MTEKNKKSKKFSVDVDTDKIMYTDISTSKNGYNVARISAKYNDKEYLSINYEWEGSKIPSFALDLMAFMKSNSMETSGVWKGKDSDYEEFSKLKK